MSPKNATLFAVLMLAIAVAAPTLADAEQNHELGSTSNQPSVFQGMVADYLAIQTALAQDTIEGVVGHARAIEKSASDLGNTFDLTTAGVEGKNSDALKKALPDLVLAASELSRAGNIKATRKSFGSLSDAMIAYRELATGDKPQVAYCPMAKQSWLQDGKKIANPYYASKMLRCGSIVEK